MTDPRIEAAARAICEYAHECEGESVQWHETTEALRDVARRYSLRALAAADAAAHVRIVPMPIPAERIEAGKNTLLCWKNGALTDEDAIGMIVCAVAEASLTDTITIPEVRNDRPIPGKEGADG